MHKLDPLKRLLPGKYSNVVLAIVFGIFSGLSGIGLLALINLSLHSTSSFSERDAIIFLGLVTLVLLSQITSSINMTRFVQTTVRDLHLQLSRKIMTAPFHLLQSLGTPRLMANLTEDVSVIASALQLVSQLCISMAWLVGGMVYMAWLSPDLFMLVLGVIIFGVVVYRLISRMAMGPLQSAREQDDVLYAHFRALTQGIKEIKLHHRRGHVFLEDELDPTAKAYCQHNISAMTIFILAAAWGGAILYFLMGIVLYGTHNWWVIANDSVVTGYILTLLYIIGPISTIIDGVPVLGRANVSLTKIATLRRELENCAEVTGTKQLDALLTDPSMIEFRNVIYRYHQDGSDFTLGPLNLELKPGELIFITGGNGSGKSSLALLLVGLYNAEEGAIMLDGKLITDDNRENYRQQFSVIFSDFYLFDSLLGLVDERVDQKALEYLKQLKLDHKVSVKNGVFSTVALSQGQRKRLALLTAYLEDRPFYVFDEWAADQDPVFKEIFYTTILSDLKARGKTVVVITHDDRYFCMADRCIKLENGKIFEITEHPVLREHKNSISDS